MVTEAGVPDEFIEWLGRNVLAYAEEFGIGMPAHAFPGWALSYLYEIDRDVAYNHTQTLGHGDAGVDGWYADMAQGQFLLCQAKYPDSGGDLIPPAGLRQLFSGLDLLQDPAAAAAKGDSLREASAALADALASDLSVVLLFALAGRVSEGTRDEIEALAKQHSLEPEVIVADLDYLYREYVARETARDLEGQDVVIPLGHRGVIELDFSSVEGAEDALVVNLDVRAFADAINPFAPMIFEQNVRYSLGHRSRINSGIRKALRSADERPSFWLYNNGLTILCSSFVREEDALRLTNPQIVNGCQTANQMIYERNSIPKGEAMVLARIIEVGRSSGAGSDLALKVSEYTNTQNPVRPADLRSNDPVQREIQALFRALETPVFYERKRGEWHSLSAADRGAYGRRVEKTDVGQRWRAYAGDPVAAVASKEDMFLDLEVYRDTFSPDRSPYAYLLAHDLFGSYGNLTNHAERPRVKEITAGAWDPSTDLGLLELNRVRRAKRLWQSHLTSLSNQILVRRYGSVTPMIAGDYLQRLSNGDDAAAYVQRLALIAFRTWMTRVGPEDDLKASLQQPESQAELTASLDNVVALAEGFETRLPDHD